MNVRIAHRELIAAVAARLAEAGLPSPGADARWLVEHVAVTTGEPDGGPGAGALEALVARRAAREPLQLVLGHTAFRTVEVLCRPGVFVPRPETELVAGEAIAAARTVVHDPTRSGPLVVEPCTGTGAIACAVLVEVPGVRVVATDADPVAAELARENLRRVRGGEAGVPAPAVRGEAQVLVGDLLAPVDPALRGHLDVLVANPPYLPAADRGSWDPEVADHDPDVALVGGTDGHEVVDGLLAMAATWLRPGGTVVVEIDERRGADAVAAATRVGLEAARTVVDLTGAERAVVARRGE